MSQAAEDTDRKPKQWLHLCRSAHFAALLALFLIGLGSTRVCSHRLSSLKEKYRDPFRATAVDVDGRVGLECGACGTLQVFVGDRPGIIRHTRAGPVRSKDWRQAILPFIEN